MGKRDSFEIILEILRLLHKSPANITRITYQTNLNHTSAEKFLSLLVKRNLLGTTLKADGRHVYAITDRGNRLLASLEDAVARLYTEQVVAG